MKDLKEFLKKEDSYFSEGHLEGWFQKQYKGRTKEEIEDMLEIEHDVSLEYENAEDELKRELTDKEKELVKTRFNKAVLKAIVYNRKKAIGYIDSCDEFEIGRE